MYNNGKIIGTQQQQQHGSVSFAGDARRKKKRIMKSCSSEARELHYKSKSYRYIKPLIGIAYLVPGMYAQRGHRG